MFDKYVYFYVKTMNKKYIDMPKKKINYLKKKYTEILAWAMNVFIYFMYL